MMPLHAHRRRKQVLLRLTGDDPIVPVVNRLVELVEILAERIDALADLLELDAAQWVEDTPDLSTYNPEERT